jgi:hypothetical protein
VNLASLLEEWCGGGRAPGKVEIETVLERIIGRGAPVCGALAAQGKEIVTVVDPDASGEKVRAIYGLKADVRVAGNDDVVLPKSDLVIVHGGAPRDWQSSLTGLSKHATKLFIVALENPLAWPAQARALAARFRGEKSNSGLSAATLRSGWGRTADLAPVLWEIGRVREHAFLDVPPLGERSAGLVGLGRIGPRLAPTHAFVVDVTPRTPQARRRLRLGAV